MRCHLKTLESEFIENVREGHGRYCNSFMNVQRLFD